MKLVPYQNPENFQETVTPFLVQHEAENNLLLGVLANLIGGEYQDHPAYLAAVHSMAGMELVVMRTPPFPVLLSYRAGPPDQDLVSLVNADLVSSYGKELAGMTGNTSLVGEFVRGWKTRSGGKAELDMAMRIYRLDAVLPVEEIPGTLRPVRSSDRALIREWLAGFQQEALQEEAVPDRLEQSVEAFLFADPALRGLTIWEVDGSPVSMAGYTGPTPHGIRVSYVYTPPELRRKGYASACVAALSQQLLDRGFDFCFLFTDLQNPTSNHIYQQIGYQPVVDVDSYRFF